MSSIVLNGDTSGAITLAAPAVAGTNTATLPAAAGTVMVSGNMPAFSAYMGANQTLSSNVNTKLIINTKEFDTANCYDAVTNYRFTPTVAGYYQINFNTRMYSSGGVITNAFATLYKNGSAFFRLLEIVPATSTATISSAGLVYMNGTTDYLEIYGTINAATGTPTVENQSGNSQYSTRFSGCLVRTA